jgi:hypothetical protein
VGNKKAKINVGVNPPAQREGVRGRASFFGIIQFTGLIKRGKKICGKS